MDRDTLLLLVFSDNAVQLCIGLRLAAGGGTVGHTVCGWGQHGGPDVREGLGCGYGTKGSQGERERAEGRGQNEGLLTLQGTADAGDPLGGAARDVTQLFSAFCICNTYKQPYCNKCSITLF